MVSARPEPLHPPRIRQAGVVTPTVTWYRGPHSELRSLFELAEDSAVELDGYIDRGHVLVAHHGRALVGHLQLLDAADSADVELKNMAVLPVHRGTGVGRVLVESALAHAAATGRTRMLVATATADIGNLRFYQRLGFRFLSVERDAFTPANGYPAGTLIDGIPLLDRIWLSWDLAVDEGASMTR